MAIASTNPTSGEVVERFEELTADQLEDRPARATADRLESEADDVAEDEAERALSVRDVQSGRAFINGHPTSHPEIPFGGVKRSGHGRELPDRGMREFMNARTVWVGG
ncbi:aldehyde dehydrogenase family protein [Streptomyces sp. BK022]|uniref:aldehyde dehydrogenase family protein n=1 Tax=Streptomyces sp. BK022 TaxID=2512123 RepID=UPI001029171C|nr:aldehyde dehydrogenase family protein [Streptomyces sp. BK022]